MLKKVEQLIKGIETKPLSEILPSTLEVALACKDFKGYCVLFHFICPVSEISQINERQRDEIIRTLLLHGVQNTDVLSIINESTEEFLDLKTISENAVSTHGIKEIEILIQEMNVSLTKSNNNISSASYHNLSDKLLNMRRLYESLRGYTLSKLSYYQQLLKWKNEAKTKKETTISEMKRIDLEKIFIVHGHHRELKESVARLVEKQGIKAIILDEQVNQGHTIIEKFERNSEVGCAICLFTADDLGCAKTETKEKMRARQNVVFETGYFIGKLGRDKVIILAEEGIEIPSDLQGVVYTNLADWKYKTLKELKAIGYKIDYEKLD